MAVTVTQLGGQSAEPYVYAHAALGATIRICRNPRCLLNRLRSVENSNLHWLVTAPKPWDGLVGELRGIVRGLG